MKKIIALLLLFCLGSVLVFAVDYGIGFFTDFNYQYADWKAVFPVQTFKDSQKIGFWGIKSFIDVQYAVINFGIKGSVTKTDLRDLYTGLVLRPDISTVYMTLGVLGKYPFKLKSIRLFPQAGFEGDFIFSYKEGGTNFEVNTAAQEDWNRHWFDFGLGADIPVGKSGKLFLRPQTLFGLALNKPAYIKKAKADVEAAGGSFSYNSFRFNIGLGAFFQIN
ncbi:hypothetical protein V1L52_02320 [Treponema sp. HNW]|uniref:outer membrane beta-barrel protein n=1 Tax=Treponema sp. HNW TaxID=3116654 RepID=UPI003D1175AE